jgi:hypothetical protein
MVRVREVSKHSVRLPIGKNADSGAVKTTVPRCEHVSAHVHASICLRDEHNFHDNVDASDLDEYERRRCSTDRRWYQVSAAVMES